MAEFRERRFTAQDGLSLYYREYGAALASGPPLLCLPGLTRNSKDFHRVAQRLAARHRIIALDYRGRGRSDYDPQPDNYQPTTYLNDIRHLLAISGAHQVVVIGTSLGGLLAMGMGAAMPTTLAGVVLNDVGPDVSPTGLGRIINYISRDRPHDDWEDAVADLKDMLPSVSLPSDAGWRRLAEATWRRGEDGRLHLDWDVRISEPLQKGAPLPDLWALFRSLRQVPVLALRGALSDILTPATFHRMAEEHPRLVPVTVPETGHVPTLEEPEAAKALDAFLAQF